MPWHLQLVVLQSQISCIHWLSLVSSWQPLWCVLRYWDSSV